MVLLPPPSPLDFAPDVSRPGAMNYIVKLVWDSISHGRLLLCRPPTYCDPFTQVVNKQECLIKLFKAIDGKFQPPRPPYCAPRSIAE